MPTENCYLFHHAFFSQLHDTTSLYKVEWTEKSSQESVSVPSPFIKWDQTNYIKGQGKTSPSGVTPLKLSSPYIIPNTRMNGKV